MRLTRTSRELQKFGLIFSGYFIFFTLLFSKGQYHYVLPGWEWLALAIFIFSIFTWPTLLLPINLLWDGLLGILHWISTRILLGIIFFFIFSPIAFFRRVLKKDVLSLSFSKRNSTYRTSVLNDANNDIRRPY